MVGIALLLTGSSSHFFVYAQLCPARQLIFHFMLQRVQNNNAGICVAWVRLLALLVKLNGIGQLWCRYIGDSVMPRQVTTLK